MDFLVDIRDAEGNIIYRNLSKKAARAICLEWNLHRTCETYRGGMYSVVEYIHPKEELK